jgi:hypothetical protein
MVRRLALGMVNPYDSFWPRDGRGLQEEEEPQQLRQQEILPQ